MAVIRFEGDTAVAAVSTSHPRTQRLVMPAAMPANEDEVNRSALWVYTLALGLVQATLIFLVWLLLRV